MRFNSSKYNKHWQDKTLNELGDFHRGKSRHRPRNDIALFFGGKHPLVQTGEIKEANLYITKHSAAYNDFGLAQSKLWPKNTLCITIAANIAETALLGYPMCFPDSVVGFSAYPDESSELFMHYIFTYIRRAIQNSATGSIQDNINIEYLTGLKLKIPLKSYQDKIAAVLSSLDTKIDCNNRINAELEAMAKTLYDYWFVQFDFPDANGKPYKSSGGKMYYNSTLKREIPVGWEVRKIEEISDVKAGGDKPKDFSEHKTPSFNIPVYANGIINDGIYGFTNEATIKIKSITISARGTIGYTVLRNKPFVPIIRLIVVTPTNAICTNYIFEFIRNCEFSKSGSVQQQLTSPMVSDLKIIYPPNDLLEKFDKFASNLTDKIEIQKDENQQLSELRDWLLPTLMNGQVTVE